MKGTYQQFRSTVPLYDKTHLAYNETAQVSVYTRKDIHLLLPVGVFSTVKEETRHLKLSGNALML